VETVYIGDDSLQMEAKLDSGADTSMLSARDIDAGPLWNLGEIVTFRVSHPTVAYDGELQAPLTRMARIRHIGGIDVRPVVLLTARLGDLSLEREFSLADHSGFDEPVLLGRNYLEGVALIDVSRTHLAEPRAEDEE